MRSYRVYASWVFVEGIEGSVICGLREAGSKHKAQDGSLTTMKGRKSHTIVVWRGVAGESRQPH